MNFFREIKIKKTINDLTKYKKKISGRDLVIYLNKRINKEELLFLLNDKEYCKKIISLPLLLHCYSNTTSCDIWQIRAMSFMDLYISDLFNLPKHLLEKNIFELIKINLPLKNIEEIINYLENKGFKPNLKKYIEILPDYKNKEFSPICYEKHEYILMQYTEYLNGIEELYCFNSTNKLNIKRIILADKLNGF